MKRFYWQCMILFVLVAMSPAVADTVIVDDNFDSYTDDFDFWSTWPSSNSSNDGILTIDEGLYPGIQGQAVDHIGGSINEYALPLGDTGILMPTENQSIVLATDIYDNPQGNMRLSVGLRSTAPENLVELGYWNANSGDTELYPLQSGNIGYAFRTILFVSNPENPNWRFFELDPSLDRADDSDEIVSPADIQEYAAANGLDAWHRWEVTITPDTLTYTLDLFRDGLNNVTGTPGVDATTVIDTVLVTDNGFNSLRLGGPSGVSSPRTTAFDNVLLKLIDVSTGLPGDFDADDDVDGDDFLIWQRGESADPLSTADLNDWKANFGTVPSGPAAIGVAVPEPGSFVLAGLALAGLAWIIRRG